MAQVESQIVGRAQGVEGECCRVRQSEHFGEFCDASVDGFEVDAEGGQH